MSKKSIIAANNQPRVSLPLVEEKGLIYVTYSGLSLNGFSFVKESGYPTLSAKWETYFGTYSKRRFFMEKKSLLWDNKKYLVAHNLWSSGYHHWLIEVLVKLAQLDPAEQFVLLIPESYPQFVFDSLALFDHLKVRPVKKRTGCLLKSCWFIGNPNSGSYHAPQLQKARALLLNHASQTTQGGEKIKVYISRQQAKTRKIINDESLSKLLKEKYGYLIINCEDYSFWEQVGLFQSCECLISIHGAGLTNMLFMDGASKVLEIHNQKHMQEPLNNCFANLAETLALDYYSFGAQVVRRYERANDYDLEINLLEFEAYLRTYLLGESTK